MKDPLAYLEEQVRMAKWQAYRTEKGGTMSVETENILYGQRLAYGSVLAMIARARLDPDTAALLQADRAYDDAALGAIEEEN